MKSQTKTGNVSIFSFQKLGIYKTSTVRILVLGAAILSLLQGPPLRAESDKAKFLNGYAELGYRYRRDGNFTDQDLTQTLSLDYFRPWEQLGDNSEVGFVFYGLLWEDIDGHPEEGKYYSFRDVVDTYDNSFAGWVYLAYGELTTEGFLKTLRLGRQESFELETVAFDGGLVTVKARKNFYITAFGGLPTNIFEDIADKNGDSVAGAYLDWRLLNNLSFLLGPHDPSSRHGVCSGFVAHCAHNQSFGKSLHARLGIKRRHNSRFILQLR
jgi:hypothetical protein